MSEQTAVTSRGNGHREAPPRARDPFLERVYHKTEAAIRKFIWYFWIQMGVFVGAILLTFAVAVVQIPQWIQASTESVGAADNAASDSASAAPVGGQSTEASPNTQQERSQYYESFMQLALPILVVVLAAMAGALGLKRLEQVDHEISMVRSELLSEQRRQEEVLAARQKEFRENVGSELTTMQSDIRQSADRLVEKAVQKRNDDLRARMSTFEKCVEDRVREIDGRLEPYRWLEERKDDLDWLVGNETIEAAHKAVSSYFEKGKKDMAIRLSKHVVEEEIPGGPDDFHNLAAQLAKENQYVLAVRILANGLVSFPENVDLLAGALKYNMSIGRLDDADVLYKRLCAIDRSQWNWRGFVFVGDYLEILGKVDDAMDLYKEFRKILPDDERGYSQPGDYYRKLGKLSKAIPVLEKGVQKTRRCSQCASMLAQAYTATGEYEKAIAAANRALESNAEEQPSSNEAFILWHRAQAEDSLIHSRASDPDQMSDGVLEEILTLCRNCVVDYRTAMQAPDAPPVLHARGPARLAILNGLLVKLGATREQMAFVFVEDQTCESVDARKTPGGEEERLPQLLAFFSKATQKGHTVRDVMRGIAKTHDVSPAEFVRGVASQEKLEIDELLAAIAEACGVEVAEVEKAIEDDPE